MTYLVLGLAAACIALGVALLTQRRKREQVTAASQQFCAAIDDLTDLMRAAEKDQNYAAREDNPHLLPCWETVQCEKKDCPAYKNPNLRCWQIAGSLCSAPDSENLFEQIEKCEKCQVYRLAMPDTFSKLTEQFNNLMAALQRKSDRLMELRLRAQRAEKLASIGEFAAGLAHEINNPLDGIRSCLVRLERDPASLSQNIEYLKLIREALERMASTVQNLLHLARRRDLHLEPTDVHAVIENVVALIKSSARQNALDLEFQFEDDIPPIKGDRYFLAEAFLNLALNAMAATPPGGTVTFRTRRVRSNDRSGDMAEVDVIDTGVGVAPEDLPKVFDPFFTTKDPGKGTGLGLTIVKRIIDEHEGTISIRSAPGVGTTAEVFLPLANGNAARDEAAVERAVP